VVPLEGCGLLSVYVQVPYKIAERDSLMRLGKALDGVITRRSEVRKIPHEVYF
jgi:hypothetical protein